jgi:hypothetical protein
MRVAIDQDLKVLLEHRRPDIPVEDAAESFQSTAPWAPGETWRKHTYLIEIPDLAALAELAKLCPDGLHVSAAGELLRLSEHPS